MNNLIKEIVKLKKTCYFISPHLDDAAFSAGGLISYLAKKTRVVVISVFTRAGKDKHSLSALAYVAKCGYKKDKVAEFYYARRKEDRQLFKKFGVEVIHLPFLDALWRKNKNQNIFYKFVSLFINDFKFIYPTYRLHISKGKIFKEDLDNLAKLQGKLKQIIKDEDNSVIFCPLCIGKHVDHIMVREACTNTFSKVIYWEDSPYNLHHEEDMDFIQKNNLKRMVFNKNQEVRKGMYPAYKTQFGKLFKEENFHLPSEAYYLQKLLTL